jgi:hypothetical protein
VDHGYVDRKCQGPRGAEAKYHLLSYRGMKKIRIIMIIDDSGMSVSVFHTLGPGVRRFGLLLNRYAIGVNLPCSVAYEVLGIKKMSESGRAGFS